MIIFYHSYFYLYKYIKIFNNFLWLIINRNYINQLWKMLQKQSNNL